MLSGDHVSCSGVCFLVIVCYCSSGLGRLYALSTKAQSGDRFYRIYTDRSTITTPGRRCCPFSPRYVPSFLSRIGFSIPTARRFSSSVANSRFRPLLIVSFNARKSPNEYALGETRSHKLISLYEARGPPTKPPGTPALYVLTLRYVVYHDTNDSVYNTRYVT